MNMAGGMKGDMSQSDMQMKCDKCGGKMKREGALMKCEDCGNTMKMDGKNDMGDKKNT